MSSHLVLIALEAWEWDIVDAEASASGVCRTEMLRELLADSLRFESRDMVELSVGADRQWKSH